jgi:nicotinate phosphoribosyltransferase
MSFTNNPVAIITSLLDTDFYKLTMMQCVFHFFKNSHAQYKFICRKNHIAEKLHPIQKNIQEQIDFLCGLSFSSADIDYLLSLGVFKEDFLLFLKAFKLNPQHITLKSDINHFELHISGPWLETILLEVPILAIISESYTQTLETPELISDAKLKLEHKIEYLKIQPQQTLTDFKFSDFGTRRRFSKDWQTYVVTTVREEIPEFLYGTSNVLLSKKIGTYPIGTMAHEYLQAFQILAPNLAMHQKAALETWLAEYQGLLSVALTDVINMDSFLSEFTPELAKQYKGLRHDSGDPMAWGHKALNYYLKNNISPKDKLLVFSDSLTFPKMLEIYKEFHRTIPVLFGIGTNLTNDFLIPPLDNVIKLTHINHQAVIKISDTPQKIVCEDPTALEKLKNTYHLNLS